MVRWIAAGAGVYAVWVILAVLRPDMWPVWAVALPLLGAATYGTCRAHEYLLVHRPAPTQSTLALTATPYSQAALPARPSGDEPPLVQQVKRAIVAAGLGDVLSVTGWRELGPEGDRHGVELEAWAADTIRTRDKNGKITEKPTPLLGTTEARQIGMKLRGILRRPLAPDWVQLTERSDQLGVYRLTVLTEDVMARIRPYREDPDSLEWTSITEPVPVGYGVDGMPYRLSLTQHGRLLGATQGGKSSLLHRIIASVTLCRDAVVWVCGNTKLYDLVGQWLEPYVGTGERPPIDWVAAGLDETLEMLAAAMHIARWRQSLPFSERRGLTRIVIILDEASFVLENRSARITYNGQRLTAGEMYLQCVKAVASAGIYLIAAHQHGVNHELGDRGGDIAANIGWSAVFPSKDQYEVGRASGHYKLPAPRHRGECIIAPSEGDPVRVKIEYIQSSDPDKPILHDGPKVHEVSWARRRFVRELDAGSAQAAGDAYARRARYVSDELIRALQTAGQPSLVADHHDPVEDAGRAAMSAAIARLLGSAAPSASDTTTGTTTAVGYRTRADRICEIVADADGVITRQEIIAALRRSGDEVSDQVVQNALGELVRQGRIQRVGQGSYAAQKVTVS